MNRSAVEQGVVGGMLITVYFCATALWIEGWYVAMAAVLQAHSPLATMAVVLAMFLMNAIVVLLLVEMNRKSRKPDPVETEEGWPFV